MLARMRSQIYSGKCSVFFVFFFVQPGFSDLGAPPQNLKNLRRRLCVCVCRLSFLCVCVVVCPLCVCVYVVCPLCVCVYVVCPLCVCVYVVCPLCVCVCVVCPFPGSGKCDCNFTLISFLQNSRCAESKHFSLPVCVFVCMCVWKRDVCMCVWKRGLSCRVWMERPFLPCVCVCVCVCVCLCVCVCVCVDGWIGFFCRTHLFSERNERNENNKRCVERCTTCVRIMSALSLSLSLTLSRACVCV